MKTKLVQHSAFILSAIWLASILAAAPGVFAGDVSPPEVWIGQDSIVISVPMNEPGTIRLRLVVATPSGIEEYTSLGDDIIWTSGALPDGSYRFEADLLTLDENGEKDGAMVNGTFDISNGSIVKEQEGDGTAEKISQYIGEAGLLDAALTAVFDFIITNVHAADLRASDSQPLVIWDDTSDGDTVDWYMYGANNAGTDNDYFHLRDATRSSVTFPINIRATPENGNSFRVDANGDIFLANGDMFIDRSSGNVGFGTTAPQYPLHGKTTSGKANMYMRLENTADSTWDIGQDSAGNFDIKIAANGHGGPTGDMLTILDENGFVGLKTSSPQGQLHIKGGATNDVFAGMGFNLVSGPGFNFGYAGNSFGRSVGFFNIRPDASATGINPSLRFMTADEQRMVITKDGDVGIGNTDPDSRLHVSGGDIRVTGGSFIDDGTNLNVPDYVFEEGYQLMPLEELSAYLDEHKHLPGVKSAKEIATGGLDLGSSQMALLEKIEVLTLYTLEQQLQLDSKQQQLEDQAQSIAKLEAMVDKLTQVINIEKQVTQ